MKSRQDKICDLLTLIALALVIAFGTASLVPDREGEAAVAPTDESTEPEPVPLTDVMEELPSTPDPRPVATADTTVQADTLAQTDEAETTDNPADTLATPAHAEPEQPAEPTHHTEQHNTPAEPEITAEPAH